MNAPIHLPVEVDHVLRLYARLAAVSARILSSARAGDWDAVSDAQQELVEVTGLMTRAEEQAAALEELQKTSRILYLTAALEDQRLATECLAAQSAVIKSEARSLLQADRLRSAYPSEGQADIPR